jgi:nucleotide-binding universal stress UspA family protein
VYPVVVGVDGSEGSLRALQFAADIAADTDDAELVVVHARYAYVAMPEGVGEAMYGDVFDRAEAVMCDAVAAVLEERRLHGKFVSRDGEPASVLCAVAEEVDAALLVIGRQRWSAIADLILGSVSQRLVDQSEVPVLLVTG